MMIKRELKMGLPELEFEIEDQLGIDSQDLSMFQ